MRSRITIRDVANQVGVSTQTVSRVVNNKPDVSKETRRRVLKAIQELGYQPNLLARSLVSNKTFTLGLIMDDLSDEFYSLIIAAAESEARRLNYFFLICSSEHNPEDEMNFLRILPSRQVDGILMLALPGSEEQYQIVMNLQTEGIPVVSIASHILGDGLSIVDVDNVDGGFQATQCLIRNGRKKVAMITGPLVSRAAQDRIKGYQRALEEAGLPFVPDQVAGGDWSYRSGYQAMNQILERFPDLDGLFAQNDRMALGAMAALRQAGRSLPEDVAVVGYDDTPDAAFAYPPLTTIRQPVNELGRTATKLLVELIENPEMKPQHILLKAELVERGSCS